MQSPADSNSTMETRRLSVAGDLRCLSDVKSRRMSMQVRRVGSGLGAWQMADVGVGFPAPLLRNALPLPGRKCRPAEDVLLLF